MICYRDVSWCSDAPRCATENCRSRLTQEHKEHADSLKLPIAWMSLKDQCGKYQEKKEWTTNE